MRVFLLLLLIPYISVLATVKVVTSTTSSLPLLKLRAPWITIRGGGSDSSQDETKELLNTTPHVNVNDASSETPPLSSSPKEISATDDDTDTPPSCTSSEDDNAAAVLGIKAHKKSNAVGDPDSDSDDDDSENDETEEEWQDLQDFLEPHQVQVQVELVQPERQQQPTSSSSSGGGGGVKQMGRTSISPRGNKRHMKNTCRITMAEAWCPYIYMPPSTEALETLVKHARTVDAFGKTRLDRRTLYAGLLLEWTRGGRTSEHAQGRKFLDPQTSQQLQAALSLATQPQWRQAAPQSSGISLSQGGTLSMQETIAMALAHSLGCGMVILDDTILSKVKSHLKENVKPAVLLESLLSMAKNKQLPSGSGSITSLLSNDVSCGLEDTFDERATFSREEMSKWEKEWTTTTTTTTVEGPLPLVLFVRTQASQNLLKSKSAVEYLQQECTSSDSIHLLVLGKGMDHDKKTTVSSRHDDEPFSQQQQQQSSGAPWFGFSPQNQNASGQNDPEGSRRFNIFLARTCNAQGTPGVIGAIAPPQAGNLFPHIMAMQARERMMIQDNSDEESSNPIRAELERWAQLLQQQQQHASGGGASSPPQFFNASLAGATTESSPSAVPSNPQVIQEALQQAMTELLDRLAQSSTCQEDSSDIDKMFAHVLQNEHLRRGIAENLARAAPALSDPKCQGVMLSVYVPPPPDKLFGTTPPKPGGWFQKMLNHYENDEDASDEDEQHSQSRSNRRKDRSSVGTDNGTEDTTKSKNDKAERNLAKLESYCRPIILQTPSDPVRQKSWEAWIARERGSVTFFENRKALHDELRLRHLSLEQHTGTRGAGSALRQMLSFKKIVPDDMENVIKCAVELEAAKSRRQQEADAEALEKDVSLDVDLSLSQLLLTEDGRVEEPPESIGMERSKKKPKSSDVKLLHPSSLETALSLVCRISPSPSGSLSLSSTPASHRSREDISALAQDKHERALVSQVVSPQDIGVTYDMIGGLSDVKELLRQSITYPLKFPHLYSEGIAREAVKGVLLFGPPGTGKTMLAKAVATEGGASFLSVDASSVENKWLGESEKNAKAVFTLARRLAPCVIFIDEVDSLLSSREGSSDDSAHGTLTSVKTTMMAEWDGLNSGTNGLGEAGSDRVVVIGSTNRPFDLDEAVLRRFPRRILVDLPDMETRKEILEVTLAENRVDPTVNLTQIAERLEGYTGSDIKEVCREAVVQISHEQAQLLDRGALSNMNEDVTQGMLQRLRPVTMEDFDKALSKLKRSVSEKGRELARVWEWNDEYGEIKKDDKNRLPQLMNMYL